MPIETDVLYGRVVLRRKAARHRLLDQPEEQGSPDNHVQGVEAGHAEVKREKELGVCIDGILTAHLLRQFIQLNFFLCEVFGTKIAGPGIVRAVIHVKIQTRDVVLDELVVIFDALDAQEDGAQNQSGNEEEGDQLFPAHLGGPYRHSHGQAATDEDDGVDGTPAQFDGAAGKRKNVRVSVAVDGVGEEEAAEEQYFGGQKDPHAKCGGFLLLLQRLKLPRQFSGAMHSVLLLDFSSRRAECRGTGGPSPKFRSDKPQYEKLDG